MAVVLVTGGNRGIGAACVRWFLHNGDQVATTYRSGDPPPVPEGGDAARFLAVRCDVTDTAQIEAAFASIELKNHIEAQSAVYLMGSIYIGVALPQFAVEGNMLTVPWVVPPGGPVGAAAPNQNNGHCIPAVAYDADPQGTFAVHEQFGNVVAGEAVHGCDHAPMAVLP